MSTTGSTLQGNSLQVFANTPQNSGGSIGSTGGTGTFGSDTNGIAIYTAGTNGSRVTDVFFSTNLGGAQPSVFLYILNGSTVYPLTILTIPAQAGSVASTPCMDALSVVNCPGLPLDSTGKPYIDLAPNSVLKFSTITSLGASTINASTIGLDY